MSLLRRITDGQHTTRAATDLFLGLAHFYAANEDWETASLYMQKSIDTFPTTVTHPVIAENEIARRRSKLNIYLDLFNFDGDNPA